MILLLIDELPTPEVTGSGTKLPSCTTRCGVSAFVHQGTNMRTEGAEGAARLWWQRSVRADAARDGWLVGAVGWAGGLRFDQQHGFFNR